MLLPGIRFDRSVGNRVSAVDHHTIADINTNVRCTRGIISALEENQISRLGRAFRDNVAYAHQTVCSQSSNTPTVAAVIDYIGNKPGAVKGGRRAAAAPHIRVSQIFLCFPNHIGKSCVRQSFARNVIVGVLAARGSVNVISENIRSVAPCLEQNSISPISSSDNPEFEITLFKPLFLSFTFRI